MSPLDTPLTGIQRRHLRKLAHTMKPTVMIGEAGVSEAVLRALDRALEDHELVKVKLRETAERKESAGRLAEQSGAELCGLVGRSVILYRPHPDEPQIELPRSSD
jgi:RNA-binding protein